MTVWVGFTQTAVEYERAGREVGQSKYTLRRMIRLSFDGMSAFSSAPLHLATLLGFVFAGLAFLAIPLVIAARIFHFFVPGVSSAIVAVLLLGGVQLITIGIVGEYIGRIYDEVKRRPLYLVRSRRNLDEHPVVEPTERERISKW
jgi:dolichol-phosphate mannosyltransferase